MPWRGMGSSSIYVYQCAISYEYIETCLSVFNASSMTLSQRLTLYDNVFFSLSCDTVCHTTYFVKCWLNTIMPMLLVFWVVGDFRLTLNFENCTVNYCTPLNVIEPTCAIARWAHMCRFPSVLCLSLDQNSTKGQK